MSGAGGGFLFFSDPERQAEFRKDILYISQIYERGT